MKKPPPYGYYGRGRLFPERVEMVDRFYTAADTFMKELDLAGYKVEREVHVYLYTDEAVIFQVWLDYRGLRVTLWDEGYCVYEVDGVTDVGDKKILDPEKVVDWLSETVAAWHTLKKN